MLLKDYISKCYYLKDLIQDLVWTNIKVLLVYLFLSRHHILTYTLLTLEYLVLTILTAFDIIFSMSEEM